MPATDLIRQAEDLKRASIDTTKGSNEVWKSRQLLQEIYQSLLTSDLEFALDKKVEQDLWNHAFKKQISSLQNQGKDKQNSRKAEVQASLNLFLDAASGFYLQLLQELCCSFNIDIPFRSHPVNIGILKEYPGSRPARKSARCSSCMYVCQDCLVHLGDISRYRNLMDQAQYYYKHAAGLVPYNGQPYNQLAILEVQHGNKLSAVFFHMRALAVLHPFPVSHVNLVKFFNKISKDNYESRQKLASNEWISSFLQFHATIYLKLDSNKSQIRLDKITTNFRNNLDPGTGFTSHQLIQICSINFYAWHCLVGRKNKKRSGDNVARKGRCTEDADADEDVGNKEKMERCNEVKNNNDVGNDGVKKTSDDADDDKHCVGDGIKDNVDGGEIDKRKKRPMYTDDSVKMKIKSKSWGSDDEEEEDVVGGGGDFNKGDENDLNNQKTKLLGKVDDDGSKNNVMKNEEDEVLRSKQLVMVSELTVSLMNQMIVKCCDDITNNIVNLHDVTLNTFLPPIQVCLGWLVVNLQLLLDTTNVQSSLCWKSLCGLLNRLVMLKNAHEKNFNDKFTKDQCMRTPLTEDYDLAYFLPMSKVHKNLDFFTPSTNVLSQNEETYMRVVRLIDRGLQISQVISNLDKCYETLGLSDLMQVKCSEVGHVLTFLCNKQDEAPLAASKTATTATATATTAATTATATAATTTAATTTIKSSLPLFLTSERKHTRTNVAMQTILMKTQKNNTTPSSNSLKLPGGNQSNESNQYSSPMPASLPSFTNISVHNKVHESKDNGGDDDGRKKSGDTLKPRKYMKVDFKDNSETVWNERLYTNLDNGYNVTCNYWNNPNSNNGNNNMTNLNILIDKNFNNSVHSDVSDSLSTQYLSLPFSPPQLLNTSNSFTQLSTMVQHQAYKQQQQLQQQQQQQQHQQQQFFSNYPWQRLDNFQSSNNNLLQNLGQDREFNVPDSKDDFCQRFFSSLNTSPKKPQLMFDPQMVQQQMLKQQSRQPNNCGALKPEDVLQQIASQHPRQTLQCYDELNDENNEFPNDVTYSEPTSCSKNYLPEEPMNPQTSDTCEQPSSSPDQSNRADETDPRLQKLFEQHSQNLQRNHYMKQQCEQLTSSFETCFPPCPTCLSPIVPIDHVICTNIEPLTFQQHQDLEKIRRQYEGKWLSKGDRNDDRFKLSYLEPEYTSMDTRSKSRSPLSSYGCNPPDDDNNNCVPSVCDSVQKFNAMYHPPNPPQICNDVLTALHSNITEELPNINCSDMTFETEDNSGFMQMQQQQQPLQQPQYQQQQQAYQQSPILKQMCQHEQYNNANNLFDNCGAIVIPPLQAEGSGKYSNYNSNSPCPASRFKDQKQITRQQMQQKNGLLFDCGEEENETKRKGNECKDGYELPFTQNSFESEDQLEKWHEQTQQNFLFYQQQKCLMLQQQKQQEPRQQPPMQQQPMYQQQMHQQLTQKQQMQQQHMQQQPMQQQQHMQEQIYHGKQQHEIKPFVLNRTFSSPFISHNSSPISSISSQRHSTFRANSNEGDYASKQFELNDDKSGYTSLFSKSTCSTKNVKDDGDDDFKPFFPVPMFEMCADKEQGMLKMKQIPPNQRKTSTTKSICPNNCNNNDGGGEMKGTSSQYSFANDGGRKNKLLLNSNNDDDGDDIYNGYKNNSENDDDDDNIQLNFEYGDAADEEDYSLFPTTSSSTTTSNSLMDCLQNDFFSKFSIVDSSKPSNKSILTNDNAYNMSNFPYQPMGASLFSDGHNNEA